MDNPAENGRLSFLGTVFLGIISWFSSAEIELWLKVVTGLGALVSAILAARYYYFATKEKKEILRDIRQREKDRLANKI